MSVLNFSLLRIFQGYLVICCLIINVLCFCCLTTAILDYHISFRLSTTFFTFLNFYFFCFYRSIKCSDIIPCFLFVCQHLFSTFFKFVNVNTQRSPNLSKNAFLHFAQMHPLVFVCFDTLLSLCSKKSH